MSDKSGWGRVGCGIESISQLQDALSSGGVAGIDISVQEHLELLSKRLEHIRGWGGAYSKIEFSPEIKMLMNRKGTTVAAEKTVGRDKVLVS